MSWKEIWENKGITEKEDFVLTDLMALDGYDTGAGCCPVEGWMFTVEMMERKLQLNRKESICEIGCGSGAFLFPLYRKGYKILSGIDYSTNLISVCKRVIPEGNFRVSEAKSTSFEPAKFDAVISNGVFNYFPDLEYTRQVIEEILRILKINGRGIILDMNDAEKKLQYETIRRNKLGQEEYERLYKDHRHLFFKRSWFKEIASEHNLKYEIFDQDITGYDNSKFRFNFYFEK
jgi:ubiquinone/menaquinone biosynthesis C-methylase UbiE